MKGNHRKHDIGVTNASFAALALVSVPVSSTEALAQDYPTKQIRLLVTTAPGAGPDLVSRLVSGKLSEALGQPIIVDNRTGASGRIATEIAARATPDGYTLMTMQSDHVAVSAMHENLSYDLITDFSPIILVGATPRILVSNPSVPVTSVKELVALLKAKPGALRYGSGGSGSAPHLTMEFFKFVAGVEIFHVPYKGSVAAITNTMTGEVHLTFNAIPPLMPLIKSGKLRALGVSSAQRTPLAPGLPSIAESVPGYESSGWYGFVAPAKTPLSILAKLNAEIVKILDVSAIREQLVGLGIEPLATSRQHFASHLKGQLEQMRKIVKVSGARAED